MDLAVSQLPDLSQLPVSFKNLQAVACNGMPCFAMENSVSQPTKLHKFCISIAVTYKVYRNNYSNINSRWQFCWPLVGSSVRTCVSNHEWECVCNKLSTHASWDKHTAMSGKVWRELAVSFSAVGCLVQQTICLPIMTLTFIYYTKILYYCRTYSKIIASDFERNGILHSS